MQPLEARQQDGPHPHHLVKRSTCVPNKYCQSWYQQGPNYCMEKGVCPIFYISIPFMCIAFIGNIAVLIHLLLRKRESSTKLFLQFTAFVNTVYMFLSPWDQIPSFMPKSLPIIEDTKDLMEYAQPATYTLFRIFDILFQFSFVLMCKDRFLRLWQPENAEKNRTRFKAVVDISKAVAVVILYCAPLLLIEYREPQYYCDICRGHMRPFIRYLESDFRDYWVYIACYNMGLPVIIQVSLPNIIIFTLNIVVKMEDPQKKEKIEKKEMNMYDSYKTDQMISWMCNVHLILEFIRPFQFCRFYERGRISKDFNEQMKAATTMMSAFSATSFVVIYFVFALRGRGWCKPSRCNKLMRKKDSLEQ